MEQDRLIVVRIALPRYVVRVWRALPPPVGYCRSDHMDLEVLAHRNQDAGVVELAELLCEAPLVRAVEVLDWNSCGVKLKNMERL